MFVPLGVQPFPTPVFTGQSWNQVPPGLRQVPKKHKKHDPNGNGGQNGQGGGQGGFPRPWPTFSCDPTVVTCQPNGTATVGRHRHRAGRRRERQPGGPGRGRRLRRPAGRPPVGATAPESPRTRLDMGVDAPGSTNTRFDGEAGRPGPARPAALAALGSTGVLLAASVLGMVLAFAEKSPCRAGAWNSYASQFQRACYTDIYPLYFGEGLSAGKVPYTGHPVEYPVLIGGAMQARRVAGADRSATRSPGAGSSSTSPCRCSRSARVVGVLATASSRAGPPADRPDAWRCPRR